MSEQARIEEILRTEIKLDAVKARVFLHITVNGMQNAAGIAEGLGIPEKEAREAAVFLAEFGAFISMPDGIYEAMHPRFTVVNMYKRMCEKTGAEFGRNKSVDSAGAALERHYECARTK